MIRKITLTLFSLFTALGFSQTDIASSNLFSSGPADWPYVFTACTVNNGNQGEQQTLAINITSLPSAGANYQVYKTTANGSDFFSNAQPLSLGLNTINVNAVSFARAVKFRFNSPDICFDSFSLNGNELLGLEDFNSSVLAVYPNPATDKITIDGVENISSIKVYSISGRLEKEVFNSNQKITVIIQQRQLRPDLQLFHQPHLQVLFQHKHQRTTRIVLVFLKTASTNVCSTTQVLETEDQ